MGSNPKLPFDIIYHIVDHLPVKSVILTNLTLCSRWFYETYNPLLYRDIHLYRPKQLARLYENERSRDKLDTTHTLRFAESVFSDVAWEGVNQNPGPVDYFIRVLQATINLERLQVLNSNHVFDDSDSIPTRAFIAELLKRAGSLHDNQPHPLLPKMHSLSVTSDLYTLYGIFINCPLVFLSVSSGKELTSSILPDHTRVSLSSADPPQPVSGPEPSLCAIPNDSTRLITSTELGSVIQDMFSAEPTCSSPVDQLTINIRPMDWEGSNPPTNPSALLWIQDMLIVAGQPRVKTLQLDFSYPDADMSPNAQLEMVLGISNVLPAVTEITLGVSQPVWRNRTHEASGDSFEYPSLPAWTPFPNHPHPGVLGWWVNALKLELPERQEGEELRRAAVSMYSAMSTRWKDLSRPDQTEAGNDARSSFDVKSLYQRLLSYV